MAKEIQFILYNLPDNSGSVQAIVQEETIFLTQKSMAYSTPRFSTGG